MALVPAPKQRLSAETLLALYLIFAEYIHYAHAIPLDQRRSQFRSFGSIVVVVSLTAIFPLHKLAWKVLARTITRLSPTGIIFELCWKLGDGVKKAA